MKDYQIGDVVPYKNTRGNIKECTIESFYLTQGRNPLWFHGIDTVTKAKVFYPVHLSKGFKKQKEN